MKTVLMKNNAQIPRKDQDPRHQKTKGDGKEERCTRKK